MSLDETYETTISIPLKPFLDVTSSLRRVFCSQVQGTQQPTTRHFRGSEGPAQILPRRGAWPTNVAESKPPCKGSWLIHGSFMVDSWLIARYCKNYHVKHEDI